MGKAKHKILLVASMALLSFALLSLACCLAYSYQRPRFIQKTNVLFDPKEKTITGVFWPWPIGRPTLGGSFDLKTYRRIRTELGSDVIITNGMKLVIHDSDGTFFVYAE